VIFWILTSFVSINFFLYVIRNILAFQSRFEFASRVLNKVFFKELTDLRKIVIKKETLN
jgi:hypothetical protein